MIRVLFHVNVIQKYWLVILSKPTHVRVFYHATQFNIFFSLFHCKNEVQATKYQNSVTNLSEKLLAFVSDMCLRVRRTVSHMIFHIISTALITSTLQSNTKRWANIPSQINFISRIRQLYGQRQKNCFGRLERNYFFALLSIEMIAWIIVINYWKDRASFKFYFVL